MPASLLDATRDADVVEVPARTVLAIDGSGAPGDDAFTRALGALYGVTYTLKFARKKQRPGSEFAIQALEGWWSAAASYRGEGVPPRGAWRWQLRLGVPGDVSAAELAEAVRLATTRKGGKLEGSREALQVTRVDLPPQRMGRALHVGAYADEPATFARIDGVLRAAGHDPGRTHLEVYLSDPGRTAPAKLRTVLLRELAEAPAPRTQRPRARPRPTPARSAAASR